MVLGLEDIPVSLAKMSFFDASVVMLGLEHSGFPGR